MALVCEVSVSLNEGHEAPRRACRRLCLRTTSPPEGRGWCCSVLLQLALRILRMPWISVMFVSCLAILQTVLVWGGPRRAYTGGDINTFIPGDCWYDGHRGNPTTFHHK